MTKPVLWRLGVAIMRKARSYGSVRGVPGDGIPNATTSKSQEQVRVAVRRADTHRRRVAPGAEPHVLLGDEERRRAGVCMAAHGSAGGSRHFIDFTLEVGRAGRVPRAGAV